MKTSIKITVCLFIHCVLQTSIWGASETWLLESRSMITKTRENPTRGNVLMLANRLDSVTRYLDKTNVDEVALRQDIQNTLLSIPGHAKYFADEIERKRAMIQPGEYTGDYDRLRVFHFETLSHLPSPETVKILGSFLYDDKDFENMTVVEAAGEKHLSGGRSPNSKYATGAFILLEIQNPPYPKSAYIADIEKWRTWYDEIKSGKKAFSFKGQKVEYRFKPDGTWVTIALINPPDDEAKPPTVNQAEPKKLEKRPLRSMKTKENQSSGNVWAWAIGIVMVLMAGLVWLRVKK
jgi:hypothetical protein